MQVELRVSKAIRPTIAVLDELCAEHIAIKGVRPLPIGDMNNAMIKFDAEHLSHLL
jgi:hypothetical protein